MKPLLGLLLLLGCALDLGASSQQGAPAPKANAAIVSVVTAHFRSQHRDAEIGVRVAAVNSTTATVYVTVTWSPLAAESWKVTCRKVDSRWRIEKKEMLSIA